MRVFTVVAMKTREQYGHGDAGAAVQLAGEHVFLGLTGVSPTTFGMKALGDPNLMRQLDGGRSLSLRTADRVLAFVADYDLDSGGPRTPPRGHRRRKPSSRARRTRRSRAMTGARLTAALECANDAGGRCALWPSGDAHACYGVSHDTATSCAFAAGSVSAARAALTGTGATPQSEGLVRVRTQVCLRTPAPVPWGRSRSINPYAGRRFERRFEAADHPFADRPAVWHHRARPGYPRWLGPQPKPPSPGRARPR